MIALWVLLVLTVAYQARISWSVLHALFAPTSVAAEPLVMSLGSDAIDWLAASSAQAGLEIGDKLISVNGKPYTGASVLAQELRRAKPGDHLQLVVNRGKGPQPIDLTLQPNPEHTWIAILVDLLLRIATPVLCVLLGFFVAFQRPGDKLAWLLLALMLSFSQGAGGNDSIRFVYGWETGIRTLAVLFSSAWSMSWPIWMCMFGVYFPERSQFDRKVPWLKWVVIAPVTIFGTLATCVQVLSLDHLYSAQTLIPLVLVLIRWVVVFYSVPISLFYIHLGMKSGTLPSPDARRRIRLIMIGSMVSLTPVFVANIAASVRHQGFNSLPAWFIIPTLLLLFLFPATLAYVIVVQRAMDVRMAVRQGLKYTLARGGMFILRFALASAMILYMIHAAEQSRVNRPTTLAVIAASFAVVVGIRRAGGWASRWIDRQFFREAYNSEQILADLSDKVRTIVETKPLLETVATRISDSLHVRKVAMLLKQGNVFQPMYALGYPEPPEARFTEGSALIELLRKHSAPLAVFQNDPGSWLQALERKETDMLAHLESELVLPLGVKGQITGFIALGGKQSEEPYSSTDLRLLQSVGVQTGLALENSRLTAAIATEVAQRERLNRELEIAREVQQRLFPQTYPPVPGIEYAGRCRPAEGVGGDYYDFVAVPNDQFGIAIGDVSGKGIPAALLMASLQASLRSQAISGTNDLAGLMSNMNRLIYDASPSNKYATFFYAQYSPAARELIYVNGGHNAPMVFRGAEVIRLDKGGPVVGLFPTGAYDQGSIQLQRGDIFVGFTDGISEAMNLADEEFDEERLMATIQTSNGLSASGMIDRLIESADVFAGGAPQHDDMTVVVVRVL